MQAFGMKVIAYDPYIADARFKKYNVKKCETLDELLKESDVITIHTPKTEETMNMITYKDWQKCKKGVRVVNCAAPAAVCIMNRIWQKRSARVWWPAPVSTCW